MSRAQGGAASLRDPDPKLPDDPFGSLLAALNALGHADSLVGVAGKSQAGMRGDCRLDRSHPCEMS